MANARYRGIVAAAPIIGMIATVAPQPARAVSPGWAAAIGLGAFALGGMMASPYAYGYPGYGYPAYGYGYPAYGYGYGAYPYAYGYGYPYSGYGYGYSYAPYGYGYSPYYQYGYR